MSRVKLAALAAANSSLLVRCNAVAGCVVLAVVDHILSAESHMSMVSCMSSCALVLLSFHFLGSLFSVNHHTVRKAPFPQQCAMDCKVRVSSFPTTPVQCVQTFGLGNPTRLKAMQSAMCSMLEGAMHMHDRLMISEHPRTSLKVALSLWTISIVGNYLR